MKSTLRFPCNYPAYIINRMSLYQMKHNDPKPTGTCISKVVSPNWGTETSTWSLFQPNLLRIGITPTKKNTNISMEHPPFEDVFQIEHIWIFSIETVSFLGEVPQFLQPDPICFKPKALTTPHADWDRSHLVAPESRVVAHPPRTRRDPRSIELESPSLPPHHGEVKCQMKIWMWKEKGLQW